MAKTNFIILQGVSELFVSGDKAHDQTYLLRRIKALSDILISGLLLASLVGCSAQKNEPDLHALEQVYHNLYLVGFSPDFPADPAVFARCQMLKQQGCHQVINRVQDALATLKNIEHEQMLELTILVIDRYCNRASATDNDSLQSCEGVLTSLYLLNSESDDAKLLAAFQKFDKQKNR